MWTLFALFERISNCSKLLAVSRTSRSWNEVIDWSKNCVNSLTVLSSIIISFVEIWIFLGRFLLFLLNFKSLFYIEISYKLTNKRFNCIHLKWSRVNFEAKYGINIPISDSVI